MDILNYVYSGGSIYYAKTAPMTIENKFQLQKRVILWEIFLSTSNGSYVDVHACVCVCVQTFQKHLTLAKMDKIYNYTL